MESMQKPRLVVFDVEGVLIPKNRFFFEVGRTLGFWKLIRLLLLGFLYEVGALRLDSALRRIFGEMHGMKLETMAEVFNRIPASPYLQGFFEQLHSRGCKIALISSGLPTILVEKLAECVGAQYAYGIDVEIVNGRVTGKIGGDAIEKNGKLKIFSRIITQENLRLRDCAVVADDRNNSCLYLPGMLKIGFNPDFVLRVKADRVVNGRLQGIIPIIDGEPHKRSFPSTNDFVREDIHASGIFMPVIASLIGVPIVASIIIVIAIIYTASELFRLQGRQLPFISAVTRHAASQSEIYGFAAAPLYFACGIVLTLVLFPAQAAGAAIAMFCLGDSTASLFGGMISTSLPFNKGKTWEGSLVGFFFAFLAGCFFVPPQIALIGAAIAMTVEVLPLPLNDNVLIPVITGAALTLLL
ncbi:MAG: HAD-IB family phosphatase [Candidatus Bathyarchaeota archaeon]|nr:HAD-IB family phosphatase [Candidatus Bathyarchaeota archaeon]